jgi:hypothetical protein
MAQGMAMGLLIGLALSITGCLSVGQSKLAEGPTIQQIKVWETTREQVIALLGEPASRRAIEMGGANREWWAYDYTTSVINPLDYIFLYGLWMNGIGTPDQRYDLSLFFDHRGVVSGYSHTKADYDLGRPFTTMQVTSDSNKSTGWSPPSSRTVQFEDKLDFRY